MHFNQQEDVTNEAIENLTDSVRKRLMSAPEAWGPLHVVAVIADEAAKHAIATSDGKRAVADVIKEGSL